MGYIRLVPGDFLAALDDDEKFFFNRGSLCHMVLSPVNGKPVRQVVAAVIISRESCLQASIFAYAVMAMGLDEGLEFLDRTDGVDGLLMTEEEGISVSSGLGDRFWR